MVKLGPLRHVDALSQTWKGSKTPSVPVPEAWGRSKMLMTAGADVYAGLVAVRPAGRRATLKDSEFLGPEAWDPPLQARPHCVLNMVSRSVSRGSGVLRTAHGSVTWDKALSL